MAKQVVVRPDGLAQSVREIAQRLYTLAKTVDSLVALPLLGGRLITSVDLSAVTVSIEHGLGRRFTGWLVVDSTANAVVYRDTASVADSRTFLPLKASAATTVSLWVF